MIDFNEVLNAAVQKTIDTAVDSAMALDAVKDAEEAQRIKDDAAKDLAEKLATDAAQDAIVLKAKDDDIAAKAAQIVALNKRIAELEAGNPGTPTDPGVPAGEWPTKLTTGVPAGTVLKASGSIKVTKAGTVIENLDIDGSVTVLADNVTVQKCRIRGGAQFLVDSRGVKGFIARNNTIDGQMKTGNSYGAIGSGNFIGNLISGCENGILPEANSVVSGNFIFGLRDSAEAHCDGIPMHGGHSHIRVEGNWVEMTAGTAAVYVTNDFGDVGVDDIIINHNALFARPLGVTKGGSGSAIHIAEKDGRPRITNVVITNNHCSRGVYTYIFSDASAVVKMLGNVDFNTKATISS